MAPEYGKLFVVLMGLGTVFFGLICIIVLTTIMGKIIGSMKSKQPAKAAAAPAEVKKAAAPAPQQTNPGIPTEVVVAIMSALSEDPSISSRGWNITNIQKSI